MKKFFVFAIILLASFMIFGCSTDEDKNDNNGGNQSEVVLYINEILSKSDVYDDWFEIYNPNDQAVDISGFYVYDSGTTDNKYKLPNGTSIDAKGFLVIWCDDGNTDLHTNFKLSSSGDEIWLEDANENEIDNKAFGAITPESSLGRNPDGSDNWEEFDTPTPGLSNTGEAPNTPPVIAAPTIEPATPTPEDTVIVTVQITDDNEVASAKLYYMGGERDYVAVDMSSIGNDLFTATIPPFADSTQVSYYITAKDDEGAEKQSDTYTYTVLEGEFVPDPGLYINEFMASNDSSYADENGDFDDWIEIFNAYDEAKDIGGMYITDDLADPTAYQIPDTNPELTTIPAGGYLILWADKEPEQGILHVDLKLSSGGEQIGLFEADGTTVVDSLTFGEQTTDISMGRIPDGSDNWQFFETPTPGASNGE